jgi:hypothetical protein
MGRTKTVPLSAGSTRACNGVMSLFLTRGDEILFGPPPSQFESSMMNATDIGGLYNEDHNADARDRRPVPICSTNQSGNRRTGIREPSGAIIDLRK